MKALDLNNLINQKQAEENSRIVEILCANDEKQTQLPPVTEEMLALYFAFLKKNLPIGLKLTGRKTFGYFAWEEPYIWGVRPVQEYQQKRKTMAGLKDQFTLQQLLPADKKNNQILAKVARLSDNQFFILPLTDLQTSELESERYKNVLEDFHFWYENYLPA